MPPLLNSLTIDNLRARWNIWTNGSNNRRIFGAAFVVGIATIAVQALSLGKEVLVASSFGVSDAIDAFSIAFLVPMFFVNVVAEPIMAALMPIYIQVKADEGVEAAETYISGVMVICFMFIMGITILLFISSPYIIPYLGSGFGPEKIVLTQNLFYMLLPIIFISSYSSIFSSLFNSDDKFGLPALTRGAIPFFSCLALIFLGSSYGVYSLAIGFVVGAAVQLVLLFWGMKKWGIKISFRWPGINPSIRNMFAQYLPLVAAAFFGYGIHVVGHVMAATLPEGSVAALNYGKKFVDPILGLGGVALGTAVLPYFSKMVTARDFTGLSHTLKTYTFKILQITVPLSILMFVFSEPLIRFFFERGAFNSADTKVVGVVQAMFVLQIPFIILSILGFRLLYALKKNRLAMVIEGVSLVFCVALSFVLMKTMGVAGIALSISFSYLLSTSIVYFYIYKNLLV